MAGFGPTPSSTRQPGRGLGGKPLRLLPADGRQGPPPKWPFQGRAPNVWRELWKLPQAVAWEELHLQRVVARYCQKLVQAEKRDASAALQSEVRQLEDRLGLSALAMLRLKWEIAAVAVPARSESTSEVANLDEYRKLYGPA